MIYSWQEPQWQQLLRLRKEQRLPHALLFQGPAGLGKHALAVHFAKFLLCQAEPALEVCGHCHACHLLRADSHPDFRQIQPEEAGQAIKIDQIRELSEFVQQTAHQGGLRVTLIQPAAALNKAAANALLKTLEEPAPQALLILICDHPGQLPITIVSRCQQVRFWTPQPALALDWLRSQEPAVAWEPLLEATQGAPLLAQRWQQEGVWPAYQNFMQDLAALTQATADPLQLALQWKDANLLWIFNLFFQWLLKRLHLLLQEGVANRSQQTHQLLDFINYLQALRAEALGPYNLNQQLLLESIFIRWMQYVSR